MALMDDLEAILVAAALGTSGVDIIKGRAPESPDRLIAIIPYGGIGPERTHSGTDRRFPRVQVIARSPDPEAAYASAEAVRSAFRGFTQQSIGSAVYEAILPVTEPQPLSLDTQGRTLVAISYEVRWHNA